MKKFTVVAKAVEYYEETIILGRESTKENAEIVFETMFPGITFEDITVEEVQE